MIPEGKAKISWGTVFPLKEYLKNRLILMLIQNLFRYAISFSADMNISGI